MPSVPFIKKDGEGHLLSARTDKQTSLMLLLVKDGRIENYVRPAATNERMSLALSLMKGGEYSRTTHSLPGPTSKNGQCHSS